MYVLIGTVAVCYLIPTCIKLFLDFYNKKEEQKKKLALIRLIKKLAELVSEKEITD